MGYVSWISSWLVIVYITLKASIYVFFLAKSVYWLRSLNLQPMHPSFSDPFLLPIRRCPSKLRSLEKSFGLVVQKCCLSTPQLSTVDHSACISMKSTAICVKLAWIARFLSQALERTRRSQLRLLTAFNSGLCNRLSIAKCLFAGELG